MAPRRHDHAFHFHLLAFLLIWLSTQTVLVILDPEVVRGAQIDADGYMRLVRVEQLLDTGDWYDGAISRSNWPLGEDHHWTRPLDILLLALALPFRLLFDWRDALAIAGAIVSPICHLAICLLAVWVVAPLCRGPERFLAMPAVLVQPGLLAYGTAGRADHHCLILLLFFAALGAWIRALLAPHRKGPPLAAGMLSGLGVWVSPESLLPLAVLLASGAIAWILAGPLMRRPNSFLCSGLVSGILIAIPLQHPPEAWWAVAADQISITHLTVALLALGFWWAVGLTRILHHERAAGTSAVTPDDAVSGRMHRLALGAAGALLFIVAVRLLHPEFFRGPWSDVDPEVIGVWLRFVKELQPLLPREPAGLGLFLIHLGPAIALVPLLGWWVRSGKSDPRRFVWILLLVSLVAYVPLAAYQMRFSGYVGAVTAIAMIEAARRLLARTEVLRSSPRRRLARVGVMGGILLGGLLSGLAAEALTGGPDERHAPAVASQRDGECSLSRLSGVLTDPDGLGERPHTIAAYIDFGPELLYRTPHRVLAGPYHRNHQGILAAYRLLTATDERKVRALAEARQVDLILLCPTADRPYFLRKEEEDSLYARLVDGRAPRWIHPLRLPRQAPDGFLLFSVD